MDAQFFLPMDPRATTVAEQLKKAQRVVVFSGAGMSAESGISTFRQPEVGVWANKLGLAYFGTPFGWWRMYLTTTQENRN